jgi:hypothetical protein
MQVGDKFTQAKKAADSFVRLAPEGYSFAVVMFESTSMVVCPVTSDRNRVAAAIKDLQVNGSTALQDGIGDGLTLLRGISGRRLVLTLTDGEENVSARWRGAAGKQQLLDEAARDGTTVSVIGLGADVQAAYLEEFKRTGGFYLFSPSEKELQSQFEVVQVALRSEWQFEYTSPQGAVDGRSRPVTVNVLREGQTVATASRAYVSPGLVPSVRGTHWPFLLLLGALAVFPRSLTVIRSCFATRGFRQANVMPLPTVDPCVGRSDPNGGRLSAGDPVVRCPGCTVPHHVRSWRLNQCKCMRDGLGTGPYCYHGLLPRWARRLLDWASGGAVNATGRKWLCRCAGDDEGY